MKVVKLEDVMKLKKVSEHLRNKAKGMRHQDAVYMLAITPSQLDHIADRLEEMAFEVDDPK